MMTATETATPVASSTDREAWHAARAEGVTASEIHKIATGSKRTWRRILDDKLNGSTFRGNRHTRRGNEREAFVLAAAADLVGLDDFTPNDYVHAAADQPLYLATPDGLGTFHAEPVGVEGKSRAHGADVSKVPADHYDQSQWGMRITGYARWLYAVEVMGEDGEPTLDDPHVEWILRDDKRIAELEAKAGEFIAWREAGAPETDDDLPDDFESIVQPWVEADARAKAAAAAAKALEKPVRALIARRASAATDGWKASSDVGGFTYSVTEKTVLDEAAWQEAEPDGYAEVQRMKAAIAEIEKTAADLYPKITQSTRLLAVQPKGEDQ